MPGAVGIIGRRSIAHRRGRRTNFVTSPIGVASATKATNTLTVVFNQPVSLSGLPAYTTTVSGVTVVSAALTSPTTLQLTFSASVATATTFTIPFEDAAIRNASGGYAISGTFPCT